MKKRFAIPCLLLLLAACNQPQKQAEAPFVSDAAVENLKGNVTQIETVTYLVDSSGKMGDVKSKNTEKFDSLGNISAIARLGGKDSLVSDSKFEHDAQGYLTKMVTTNDKGIITYHLELKVDSVGKFVEVKSLDSNGALIATYKEISQNKFMQVGGATGYKPDGTIKHSFVNLYDSIYYVGGTNKDSAGKLTYEGKVLLSEKHDDSVLTEMVVEKNDKTKKDSTTNTTTTYTYEEWDKQGNWIARTEHENNKPAKIIKRIIVYKP